MNKDEYKRQIELYEKTHTITKLPSYTPIDTNKHTIYSHSKRSRGGFPSFTKPAGFRNSSVYSYLEKYTSNERVKDVDNHISKYRKQERDAA
tara:strand:- start:242 stop:517 length:276 start_codon:yes stop_codon:yes gene_type:complete